jgi:hemolysin III
MTGQELQTRIGTNWRGGRIGTLAEKVADGIVHGVGLVLALVAGTVLLTLSILRTAPAEVPAIAIYVGAFVLLLGVSMASNLWPQNAVKRVLARFDQAAIFLFIAATYTPFLIGVWGTPRGVGLTVFVWSASLIGVTLKLALPQRFSRLAIPFYLAIGWSGVLVFQDLARTLPQQALILLRAGGLCYSFGIVFHLWQKLKFNTALWHGFVVIGASLHLFAIFEAMVFSRW